TPRVARRRSSRTESRDSRRRGGTGRNGAVNVLWQGFDPTRGACGPRGTACLKLAERGCGGGDNAPEGVLPEQAAEILDRGPYRRPQLWVAGDSHGLEEEQCREGEVLGIRCISLLYLLR